MLALQRKEGEYLIIRNNLDTIFVTVPKILSRKYVRVGIDAPKHYKVLREEACEGSEISYKLNLVQLSELDFFQKEDLELPINAIVKTHGSKHHRYYYCVCCHDCFRVVKIMNLDVLSILDNLNFSSQRNLLLSCDENAVIYRDLVYHAIARESRFSFKR